jgi:hypothetical protein
MGPVSIQSQPTNPAVATDGPHLLQVTPSRNPIPTIRYTMRHMRTIRARALLHFLAEDRALDRTYKARGENHQWRYTRSISRPSFLAKFAALSDPDPSPFGISRTPKLAPAIVLSSQDQYGPVRQGRSHPNSSRILGRVRSSPPSYAHNAPLLSVFCSRSPPASREDTIRPPETGRSFRLAWLGPLVTVQIWFQLCVNRR